MNIIGKNAILLPKIKDFSKWAVIACDQFTSQPEYWNKLKEYVGDKPSTLNLILPEIYLNNNIDKRIDDINSTMGEYLNGDMFKELDGFVLVEREVDGGKRRVGLVLAIDLEEYDYHKVNAVIRATEETIADRLPVRMEIRKNAPIELPHVLLLVDDRDCDIIESIYAEREKLPLLYDFELNMGGGRIKGYSVTDTQPVIEKFYKLLDEGVQKQKYGYNAGILFVVGDGNHSVAAAKEHWNNLKKTLSDEEQKVHPARYLLAEVVNIYDKGMDFEPIHRVISNVDGHFAEELQEYLGGGDGTLKLVTPNGDIEIGCPIQSSLTIRLTQEFLESKAESHGWCVDYVHGELHVRDVVANINGVGILMPQFPKEDLIKYVVTEGNLPKKAFSIGSAEHKKYYIEAKRIK